VHALGRGFYDVTFMMVCASYGVCVTPLKFRHSNLLLFTIHVCSTKIIYLKNMLGPNNWIDGVVLALGCIQEK
jgi:hypothetical protein